MSKKILALALFAIMVFSIVPFASAAATGTGDVIRLEMVNQNQKDAPNTDKCPIVGKEGSALTDGTNILTLRTAFSKLNKTSKDYLTSDYVKYDIYAYISFAVNTDADDNELDYKVTAATDSVTHTELANADNKTDGKILLNSIPAGGDQKVKDAAAAIKTLTNFSDMTVNNSKISDTAIAAAELVSVEIDNVMQLCVKIKVGTFEFSSADAKNTYTVKYKYGTGAASARVAVVETNYNNTDGSDKPVKDMYFTAARTGDPGVYSIYEQGGVLYIDYADDIGFGEAPRTVIPVNFTFFEDSGKTVRIPASGQLAYVTSGSSGVVFDVSSADDPSHTNYTTVIPSTQLNWKYQHDNEKGTVAAESTQKAMINKLNIASNGARDSSDLANKSGTGRLAAKNNDVTTIGIVLPERKTDAPLIAQTNGKLKLVVEGKDYEYESANMDVVFRPLPRNVITTAVIDTKSEITLKLGDSQKIIVASASATTYNDYDFRLVESTSVKQKLFIDGMNVKGIALGTATVQIQEKATGRTLGQITVHVVADGTTTEPAPSAAAWRVVVRTLNVRTGPGTNYGKVGTLSMNTVVTGEDMGNGWVQIGANQFVSKTFLTPVSVNASTIGNYTVTASSLNVRSGPGSSYAKIGSLPRNSVVEVVALQNGWAQLASGGWVSTLHIK